MPSALSFPSGGQGLISPALADQFGDVGALVGGLQMWFIEARETLATLDEVCNELELINSSVLDVLQTYLSMWQQQRPARAQAFDFDLSDLQEQGHRSHEFCMQTSESNTRCIPLLARKAGINWVAMPRRKRPDQSASKHAPEATRDIGHTVRFPGVQVLDLARGQSQGGMLKTCQQPPPPPVIQGSVYTPGIRPPSATRPACQATDSSPSSRKWTATTPASTQAAPVDRTRRLAKCMAAPDGRRKKQSKATVFKNNTAQANSPQP